MHRSQFLIRRAILRLDRVRNAGFQRDVGASLVEYALLVALIAVVCVAAVAFFGGETSETFSRVGVSVENV